MKMVFTNVEESTRLVGLYSDIYVIEESSLDAI